jgi:thiol peroxidase
MATITINGESVHTSGELPALGAQAPQFELTDNALEQRTLFDYEGRAKLISMVPSLDTPVCAASTREFYRRVADLEGIQLLVVSADLPFAQGRFCTTEGMSEVVTLSMMRSRDFAMDYGVLMVDGPLTGLSARAVLLVDANDRVVYRELVSELTREPDYRAIMAAVEKMCGGEAADE